MKNHLANNRITYSIIISIVQSIALGVYLAVYSDKIINGETPLQAFLVVGRHNILLLIAVLLFAFQIYFGFLERDQESNKKEKLVNSILKASCNTLIYPHSNLHIRSIVTVCDYKKRTRTTRFSYNIESAPERTATYDIDFGTTGQAVLKKIPVAEALPANHISTYSERNGKYVEPDLKCVLAAPIFSLQNRSMVIAVLAFDSTESIEKMKFNTRKSKEIAQMWADVLAHIIK